MLTLGKHKNKKPKKPKHKNDLPPQLAHLSRERDERYHPFVDKGHLESYLKISKIRLQSRLDERNIYSIVSSEFNKDKQEMYYTIMTGNKPLSFNMDYMLQCYQPYAIA